MRETSIVKKCGVERIIVRGETGSLDRSKVGVVEEEEEKNRRGGTDG